VTENLPIILSVEVMGISESTTPLKARFKDGENQEERLMHRRIWMILRRGRKCVRLMCLPTMNIVSLHYQYSEESGVQEEKEEYSALGEIWNLCRERNSPSRTVGWR
jgi:hypothetical protein